MANFFKNNQANQNVSERDLLLSKYHNSRHNILLVVIFTAINIALLVANADSYFLFSAFIPFALVDLGMYFCGMYPAELYGEEFAELVFVDKAFFVTMLVIAVISVVLYLLSWILSKKPRVGWMIFALVFFILDTLGMFAVTGFAVDSIVDVIFHIWVIVSLISGIAAYYKLKKLPEDVPVDSSDAAEAPAEVAQVGSMLNGESMNDDMNCF